MVKKKNVEDVSESKNKQRIVAVLPGNGWTMTVCDEKKEEEVLAFIVVEVTCTDGVSVHAEIRAVSVEAPFIEYSPYPDEELPYRLVTKKKTH